MQKRKGFLICPVRGHDPKETEAIIQQLENDGWNMHWPPRDTDQTDYTGGFRICVDNREAIKNCDMVFFIWDGKSQGCLFDLGMAFAYKKPLTVLDAPPSTDGKSFQNMARYWGQGDKVAN